jgi:hypothetical protein
MFGTSAMAPGRAIDRSPADLDFGVAIMIKSILVAFMLAVALGFGATVVTTMPAEAGIRVPG